jgi:hypothetical protein
MRMMKATVVATGALVAVAAMSAAPAFAATSSTPSASAAHAAADYVGKHRAESTTAADALWAENAPAGWSAPWDVKPAPLISVLDGSVVNILPWQICGSTVTAGVGGTVPVNSPNTVLGDCNNGNTALVH